MRYHIKHILWSQLRALSFFSFSLFVFPTAPDLIFKFAQWSAKIDSSLINICPGILIVYYFNFLQTLVGVLYLTRQRPFFIIKPQIFGMNCQIVRIFGPKVVPCNDSIIEVFGNHPSKSFENTKQMFIIFQYYGFFDWPSLMQSDKRHSRPPLELLV